MSELIDMSDVTSTDTGDNAGELFMFVKLLLFMFVKFYCVSLFGPGIIKTMIF